MKMMKKSFSAAALLLLLSMSLCSALEVSLEPLRRNVALGRFIQLTLSSDKNIDHIDYPELSNARWQTNYSSTGVHSINGKVTYRRNLLIVPEKEGDLVIPAFKVRSGRESAMTREVKLRVLPRPAPGKNEVSLSDVIKGKITLSPSRGEIFAGEEITIECDLLVDERFLSRIRPGYFPELRSTGNAVFSTYTYRGSRVRFRTAEPAEELVGNTPFMRYRFTARCRVLTPGIFAPEGTIRVGVVQQRSSFDGMDDFFGGFSSSFFGSEVVHYTVTLAKAPALTVKALPPVPAGASNTLLVGKWQVSGMLSSSSLRQGEVAELTLLFKGKGAAENFHAPKAEFPGFRVYPPEVTKKDNEVTVKYALVPLEPGEKVIKLSPGTFDPVLKRWSVTPLEFKAAVAGALQKPPAAVQKNFTPAAEQKSVLPAESDPPEPGIFYQKNSRGKKVLLPLYRNTLGYLLLFALGFPLAALGIEIFFRRREKELNTPQLQQQRARRKACALLAKELKSKGDTPEFRAKVVPLLGESLGLTAGATASEIAGKLSDPELCRYFAELDAAGFSPDAGKDMTLSASGKKALGKILRKFSCFLLLLGTAFSLQGGGLNDSFNRGDFAAAAARYRGLMGNSTTGYYPNMLYNYGNCQYYLNDLPEARWALNLALLLAPDDGQIRANLQLVNSRLFRSVQERSFSGALRDLRNRIRCDVFLMLGAFFWGMIWIFWSFRRKLGSSLFFGLAGTALVLMLLCFISFAAQLKGSYSSRNVTVIGGRVELRTLPGKNVGKSEITLPGGGDAELLQRDNSGFCRIRIDGREGWVPEKLLKPTLPGGVF